jgi:hypothetical protein
MYRTLSLILLVASSWAHASESSDLLKSCVTALNRAQPKTKIHYFETADTQGNNTYTYDIHSVVAVQGKDVNVIDLNGAGGAGDCSTFQLHGNAILLSTSKSVTSHGSRAMPLAFNVAGGDVAPNVTAGEINLLTRTPPTYSGCNGAPLREVIEVMADAFSSLKGDQGDTANTARAVCSKWSDLIPTELSAAKTRLQSYLPPTGKNPDATKPVEAQPD